MAIKATVGELFAAVPALQRLMQARMAAPVAYRVARLGRSVEDALKPAEEQRQRLAEALRAAVEEARQEEGLAVTNEGGAAVPLSAAGEAKVAARQEELNAELAELLAVEVEIDGERIGLASLGGVEIAPGELAGALFLFEDVEQ